MTLLALPFTNIVGTNGTFGFPCTDVMGTNDTFGCSLH
jgi:hypothetical protein